MREGIHPDYVESTVTCSCGEKFKTRSTNSELHIELCSKCHPFYTGKQKFVDTGGRVQRFADKFGNAATATLEKEAAVRDARVKAAEEAAEEARRVREAKEADKATRAARFESAQPRVRKAEATEASAAEVVAEATDEPVADAVDEPAAEAVEATDEPVAEEVAEEAAEEAAE
ncbi:MAG: 50S ribosomal protein L31 [Actinomycetota bacterium]|nr:50S ribosomal protein L31 [Actinomycetota bacterium]